MPISNGYTYTIAGSDCIITDYDPTTSSHGYNPDIPATLDGYNVIELDTTSFANKSLSSVTISVALDLDDRVFQDNTGMSVILDADVTTNGVGSYLNPPFLSCNIGAGLTITSNVTSIPRYMFRNSGVSSLSLPSSVTSIAQDGFYNCSISSLTFDYPVNIASSAFYSNNNISVTLNANITTSGVSSYLYAPFDACTIGSNLTITSNVTTVPSLLFCQAGVSSLSLPSSVTSIGSYTFYNCPITELTLPSSVTGIGGYAFYNCSIASLSFDYPVDIASYSFYSNNNISVTLNADITTSGVSSYLYAPFASCTIGSGLTITSNVTTVPSLLFCQAGVSSLSLPSSVTDVDYYAFYNCEITSLSLDYPVDLASYAFYSNNNMSLTLNADITTAGTTSYLYGPFNSCGIDSNLTITSNVTSLPDNILASAGVTSLSLPSSVTAVGARSFYDCAIASLSLDYPVELRDHAFYSNNNLALTLNADVTTNMNPTYPAFDSCTIGENLTITSNVTTVPKYLFRSAGVTSLSLPSSVVVVDDQAFYQCSIASLTLDHEIDFGDYAFYGNSGLALTLDADVTTTRALSSSPPFYGCSIGSGLIIGSSTTSIPNYLLKQSGLTTTELPSSVTSIGTESFSGNTALADFYVRNESMSFGSNCLLDNMSDVSPGVIYGKPGSTAQTYATSITNYTFNYIRPLDFAWTNTKTSEGSFNLTAAEWNSFLLSINEFRIYKSLSNSPFVAVSQGETFTAVEFNEVRDSLNDLSAFFTGGKTIPTTKSQGDIIQASYLNDMRDALNSIA